MRLHQHRGEELAGGVEDLPKSRAQKAEGAGVAREGGSRLLTRGEVRAEVAQVPFHWRHGVRDQHGAVRAQNIQRCFKAAGVDVMAIGNDTGKETSVFECGANEPRFAR